MDNIFESQEEPGQETSAEPRPGARRIISRPQFTVRHTPASSCDFEPHTHTDFTVTVVLSGSMSVTIGADHYDLSPGQIALTDIGRSHGGRAVGAEFLSISLSPAVVNEMVTELGLTRANAEITFRASLVTDELISDMARTISAEIAREKLGHGLMLDALVRQLVIHLLRSHLTVRKSARVELSRAGPVDRRLRRALEFMHDNYSRDLSLEEIASAAYLSEYHFARLFKQITGLTPHVYLANLRLERARRLLAETSFSISEIAGMVGYQSQSHFTKIFKSVTGLTPRAYRDAGTGGR
ncbi:MAG TPA: AraC family transcriptional regulator [Blastocatellia bacterium]|jgi:AraC family transcriptional regulator|nr:AraC family transcriptional regulator [Blastocatellia bacterium]